MKNLDSIDAKAKEKINNIAHTCRIVSPFSETTSQAYSIVTHSERIISDNMAFMSIMTGKVVN